MAAEAFEFQARVAALADDNVTMAPRCPAASPPRR